MRLFFALDITTEDKQAIYDFQRQLSLPFSPIERENFHITLTFLGQISSDQQSQLQKAIPGLIHQLHLHQPQLLDLNCLAHFKRPKVLFLGLQTIPAWLLSLAEEIRQCAIDLGIHQELRRFRPHVTLYRKAKDLPALTQMPSVPIQVSSLSLYQSLSTPTGVQYTPVQQWPLIN